MRSAKLGEDAFPMVSLRRIQKDWNEFGETDPFWAVITVPELRGNKWEQESFFQTGRWEISQVMDRVKTLTPDLARRRALDFGCGVGRLSRALAEHFDEVVGVDIAPSMIELATEISSEGGRCRYVLNESNELRALSDDEFDFVYSNITLQHMPPRFMRRYFGEFLRVARPDGLIVFELPVPVKSWYRRTRAFAGHVRKRLAREPRMHVYWMSERKVRRYFARQGASVLEVEDSFSDGHVLRVRYSIAPRRSS